MVAPAAGSASELLIPTIGLGFVLLWLLVDMLGWRPLSIVVSTIAISFIIVGIALMISLPFSGIALSLERLVRWIAGRRDRKDHQPPPPSPLAPMAMPAPVAEPAQVNLQRRSLLTTAAIIIPGSAVAASLYGIVDSYSDVLVPEIPLRFANLPPDLEGFHILHLSDIHLGYFAFMADLEECLIAAEKRRPDLVLVSGDVADELEQLPDALRLIAGLKPKYGTFASLGNHEYYRGIRTVLMDFDRGPIPLLRESGTVVKVGATSLFIGGADDPARAGKEGGREIFLRDTVTATLDGAPSQAFHLLMSHRPEGWDEAARNGIELTVSGHYHGGVQMGWSGRGVIESLVPKNYIWGHYQRGESQLYTSAGVGHWLPLPPRLSTRGANVCVEARLGSAGQAQVSHATNPQQQNRS